MTVTGLGIVSVGAALPAAASATAAVDVLGSTQIPLATGAISALAGLTLPELTGKIAGYTLISVPSPSMPIAAQLAAATVNLATDIAAVAAIPGGAALTVALTTAIGVQVAALGAVKGFNPVLGARIEQTIAAMASMNASIAAGISGPNINLAVIAARLAELVAAEASVSAQASIASSVSAAASAQLGIAAGINANLSVGGLRLYRFDGDLSTAGAELQARFATDGLSGSFHFVVMVPTNPTAWGALQATVKTS